MEKITKYINLIETGNQIDYALNQLEHFPMTLDILSNTGVGKVVNRLRNNPSYCDKATFIVEKWKNIARNSTLLLKNQTTNKNDDASASNICKKENISTKKRKSIETVDAFSAALAAADNVEHSKPKRLKREDSILASIEKSLAEPIKPLEHLDFNYKLTQSSTNQNNEEYDPNMFKARKSTQKVYAGRKKTGYFGEVPKLFDICLKFCINNIDAIEETGNIPFYVLKPVLEKCTHTQLSRIEFFNPHFEEDTDYLWKRHCNEVFPTSQACDSETWKNCFLRLTNEREERLKSLSQKIGSNVREAILPQRKAKFSDPIAPRDARRRQIKHGTVCHSSEVTNAVELSRSRREIFKTGSFSKLNKIPSAVRNGASTSISSNCDKKNYQNNFSCKQPCYPKKGALMLKTLKMMKSRRR